MAIEYNITFPKWKPNFTTKKRFSNSSQLVRFHALRNSSGAFISRSDVRTYLLSKYSNKCSICTSEHKLEIDHIISVYDASNGLINAFELNSESNLQVLCSKCNSGKKHLFGYGKR